MIAAIKKHLKIKTNILAIIWTKKSNEEEIQKNHIYFALILNENVYSNLNFLCLYNQKCFKLVSNSLDLFVLFEIQEKSC